MELLEEDGELQSWERGLSGEMTAGMALLQKGFINADSLGDTHGADVDKMGAPVTPRPRECA